MAGRIRPIAPSTRRWGSRPAEWVGNNLKVTTTHLKEGWLRRNGVARSDAATVTEYFVRHGNHLTWNVFVQDPKYLDGAVLQEPRLHAR